MSASSQALRPEWPKSSLDGSHFRKLTRLEYTSYGLHYANNVPDHPHLIHIETHLLPTLDLMVSHFTHRPDTLYPSRFYCDMASVQTGPERPSEAVI